MQRKRGIARTVPDLKLASDDMVTCGKCGRPLPNLPSYLAKSPNSSGQFQCEDCFYRGAAGARPKRTVVGSSKEVQWREMVETLERGEKLIVADEKAA